MSNNVPWENARQPLDCVIVISVWIPGELIYTPFILVAFDHSAVSISLSTISDGYYWLPVLSLGIDRWTWELTLSPLFLFFLSSVDALFPIFFLLFLSPSHSFCSSSAPLFLCFNSHHCISPLSFLSTLPLSCIMLFQGMNTWMCLAAVTSSTLIEFLSLGFHHSHSTPTARFHFFVNFVRPQPPVCLWPKIKFPLGNNFPSIWGKVAWRILETLKGNGSCFSFYHLNTNYAFLLRVGYKKMPILPKNLIIQGIFGGHHFSRTLLAAGLQGWQCRPITLVQTEIP